ncbi:hypothetical protein RDV89_01610 [Nocardioides zeae]|uniref:Uncharacterized protein n=1 Tax=Nocardioides imazamoxiresistens TaxID=3231893 RepID=A0ABU3PRD0_9ACTN|nr:hypothetical protein [Nocardioides zeae]MDT9591746.1 hypothetical protein [Nocardioides zeae]
MAYVDVRWDNCCGEALWMTGPGWDDVGPVEPDELGLSESVQQQIAQWRDDEDGDCSPRPADERRRQLVRSLEVARLMQLELGDDHEVWRASGLRTGCPLLALEGGEADLARRVGRRAERLERVPIQQLAASANTRWRIRQWRREGRALDGAPGDARWRAEGLDIAAQLQQEVGLAHFICFLGGRTEQPPVEPFRPWGD